MQDNNEKNQQNEVVDIDNLDMEELTVDDSFYDDSEDDIDSYYNNLHRKKK